MSLKLALRAVDTLNAAVGKAVAWLIVGLTGLIVFEVFSRYVLGKPHAWAFDASNMLYGALFMLAGAYTLARNGHVRGDVLYMFLSPRSQAGLDLVLYLLFFFPGVIALAWAGAEFFTVSLAQREYSSITSDGPPIYPFKAVIPVAGVLLLLQGVVEFARSAICVYAGEWPEREGDIEEVNVEKLRVSAAAQLDSK